MVPNDIWLRTEWLNCRRTSVLRCVERYCAAAAREYRRALRRMQEVEEKMAQVEPETGRRLPSQPAQAELLNRRLAAANAEIRRYQTRLYACEREMVALRQENAELEALCEQARANSLLPPVRWSWSLRSAWAVSPCRAAACPRPTMRRLPPMRRRPLPRVPL